MSRGSRRGGRNRWLLRALTIRPEVSKTANGPPLKTFPFGTKKVYVRFIFSAKPTKGPLKVLWTQPDGSVLLRINKRITPVVSTWVASNHPLRKGTWHALLQARGVRVASAAVKIV